MSGAALVERVTVLRVVPRQEFVTFLAPGLMARCRSETRSGVTGYLNSLSGISNGLNLRKPEGFVNSPTRSNLLR